jgi:hypothetical protein
MDTKQLVEWLFSEAGAGWVFGIISLIAFIVTALKRTSPPKIVFKEISRQSLGIADSKERDRITMAFDDQPVDKLSRLRANVTNKGSEVVKDPIIKIRIPDEARFLDASIDGEFGTQQTTIDIESNIITLRMPFLNPVKPHSHVGKVVLLVDGELDGLQVTGSGEGWFLEHDESMTSEKVLRRRAFAYFFFIGLLIPSFVAYLDFMDRIPGISNWEVSWKALTTFIPILLVVGILVAWGKAWGLLASREEFVAALIYLVTGKKKQ